MSNLSKNEELIDESIESIYAQVSEVIQAKYDIKSNTLTGSEKLLENEGKLEEMEKNLQKIRNQITSNPILHNINKIILDDENWGRKLAENIYLELQTLSLSLDFCEEGDSRFKEEDIQVDKLTKIVEKKLDSEIERFESIKGGSMSSMKKKSKTNKQEELTQASNELKAHIDRLTTELADYESEFRVLENKRSEEKVFLQRQRSSEMKIIAAMSELSASNEKKTSSRHEDATSFDEYKTKCQQDIEELKIQSNNLKLNTDELKYKLVNQKDTNIKLHDEIGASKEILRKKKIYDFVQVQKDFKEKLQEELNELGNIIKDQEESSLNNHSEVQQWDDKRNEINIEFEQQRKLIEEIIQEKNKATERKDILQENIQKLSVELEGLRKINMEKEEIILRIYSERENSLLSEKKNKENSLTQTAKVIQELKDKISKLQTDIENREKISDGFSIDILEQENKELNTNIGKYIRDIEIVKKRRSIIKQRASMKPRPLLYRENSDSSQDSMLVSKKKRSQ